MRKSEYTSLLIESLASEADPERAASMKAYMRNQFDFFGLPSPIRRALAKVFLQKENRPDIAMLDKVVLELWEQPQRELQFIAMELVDKYKKELEAAHFDLLEKMILQKSWWDTVDFIASNLVGQLVRRYPEEGRERIEKWRYSGNMWLVRTCIIHQLKYKNELDEALLFSLIKENSSDNEFFIRKAIGWALRQYGKYKPERVRYFVENHELSGLSRREALKYMK